MSMTQLILFIVRKLGFAAQPMAVKAANVHTLPVRSVVPATQAEKPKRHFNGPVRTVRVVRVNEPGMASHSAGRMVMSGRMADVCAELDRLAA
ncbi:MAG: hypothetical protein RLZZ271_249 [Pseudomonadota bacterium]